MPYIPTTAEIRKNMEYRQASRNEQLRDMFAVAALSAIVARNRLNDCGDFVAGDGLLQHHRAAEYAAHTAYQFADAMLAERSK